MNKLRKYSDNGDMSRL